MTTTTNTSAVDSASEIGGQVPSIGSGGNVVGGKNPPQNCFHAAVPPKSDPTEDFFPGCVPSEVAPADNDVRQDQDRDRPRHQPRRRVVVRLFFFRMMT